MSVSSLKLLQLKLDVPLTMSALQPKHAYQEVVSILVQQTILVVLLQLAQSRITDQSVTVHLEQLEIPTKDVKFVRNYSSLFHIAISKS